MSQIKQKDFIKIEYTGSIKENGIVFDTTDEEVAKKEGIYDDKTEYGPVIICTGESYVIPGLDKRIIGLEPGKYEFDIPAEEAFGKSDPRLIQMIPISKFSQEKVKPFPGLRVQVDNRIGTIMRSGGGRVMVNFNHPLAAKDVNYKINIKDIVNDDIEKIKAIFKMEYGVRVDNVTKEADTIMIDMKADVPEKLQAIIRDRIKNYIANQNIEFVKYNTKKDEPANKPEPAEQ